MSEVREVTVGDRSWPITRFKGLKAILAGALVARVMRELPQLQEKVSTFAKDYRSKNTVVITSALAKTPRYSVLGLSPEDFTAAGGNIELPEEPTPQQVIVHVLPDMFDLARVELQRFVGLVVIPNSELEDADDADKVDDALDRLGKQIFRNGDLDEILQVVVVGWEVLEDQILSKQQDLGKLMNLPFLRAWLSTPEETEEEETPPTLPEPAPRSSDTSPIDSTGAEETSSMVSPGTSS